MARPKIPLISGRSVLITALAIIDREGLEALRIRRLGEELGVNGASLYHHFANKEEIVVGAAELALDSVRTPDDDHEDWPVWLTRNTRRTRAALLEHPNLIPVVLNRAPLGIGTSALESTAALLEDQGVPADFVLELLETLEMLAIASAMGSGSRDSLGGVVLNYHEHPTLLRAARELDNAQEQLFEDACAAVIASVQQRIAAARPSRRPARARGRRASAAAS